MANKKDSLGDRMKNYENVPKIKLMRRTPVVIRLDGKAFHTFTKGFVKPFDEVFMKTMSDTMKALCENIQGCVLGYTQSDEISLILVDYQAITTDAWFDNNVEKMCSVSASMATLFFNNAWRNNVAEWAANNDNPEQAKVYVSRLYKALFDSRVFSLPKEEVMNYLVWRQQDATRNSILSVGQANFSQKQLSGKSCNVIQDMLFTEKGINWNDYPIPCKRGVCCIKKPVAFQPKSDVWDFADNCYRMKWVIDTEIPIFNREPEYVNKLVFFD